MQSLRTAYEGFGGVLCRKSAVVPRKWTFVALDCGLRCSESGG